MTTTHYRGEYVCKWPKCGYKFQKDFSTYDDGSRHAGTTAVRCPRCGGPLRPVGDAIKVTEIKPSSVQKI